MFGVGRGYSRRFIVGNVCTSLMLVDNMVKDFFVSTILWMDRLYLCNWCVFYRKVFVSVFVVCVLIQQCGEGCSSLICALYHSII